ncbi:MAG: ATP-binding protein [Bacteroidota bacterium]
MLLKSEIENAYLLQQDKIKQNKSNVSRNKVASIQTDNSFIQVISGIRRCGKSTLLNFLMQKYDKVAYFNFEDPRIINFEVSDFSKLEEIIPKNVQAYFFDEIQNVAQWEVYIRQLHDYGKKVFVTGSNASLLSKDLGTRLTGRYLNTELFPFSYVEFLDFEKKEPSLQTLSNYLERGGFPEYLKSNNVEVLQNLFKDIVFRDIAIRYGIRNTKTLIDIALFLISNIAKETTYTSLKKTFQVGSTNTVVDYLTWLEDAYLLFFLHKFSYSAKSISVNPRKVYAIDNGLINANSLSFSSDNGRKLENAVYIFLRNKGAKMYYFREKNECDFVLFEKEKCTTAIQVCYEINEDNKTRELNGLLEAMQFFDLKEGIIITQNQKDTLQMEDKTILMIPAFDYFYKS